MTVLLFLLPSLAACLVLTGIHTYLGIHVIGRGVIFVDIALAQLTALGMTVGFLMGYPPEGQIAYFFALGFTSWGAVFFSYFREEKLPQEALIGVTFAVSSALAILIADRLPHGSEHLKQILSGNILWVTWPQILKTAVIYSLLGIFHFLFRKKMLEVSMNPKGAKEKGIRLWVWDLLFYLSFGVVITSSVQMGGILLVFAFLIVPALVSLLFCVTIRGRLFLGWIVGTLASIMGIGASYWFDFPTGPMIVTLFGLMLFASLVFYRRRRNVLDS